jgi:hypothetical protein
MVRFFRTGSSSRADTNWCVDDRVVGLVGNDERVGSLQDVPVGEQLSLGVHDAGGLHGLENTAILAPGRCGRSASRFQCIYDAGWFTAAGAALGLSQASVSRAVADLERVLDLSLFRRAGRRAEPTIPAQRVTVSCAPHPGGDRQDHGEDRTVLTFDQREPGRRRTRHFVTNLHQDSMSDPHQ